MSSQAADSTLRAYYRQEFERLRREFEANGSGAATVRDRTAIVDKLVSQLWDQHVATSSGFALVALGGFGRRALFPHSDVDLLFLAENEALRSRMKEPVRGICQEMWDIGLRVSPTTRTLDDCARFDQDNVEFTISLLDCRFLIGEAALFERLRGKILPQLVARESDVLVRWGGEEFLIVCRSTDRSNAPLLCARILEVISAVPYRLDNGAEVTLTCSAGWAPFPWIPEAVDALTLENVIEISDRALYLAKNTGRNQGVGIVPSREAARAPYQVRIEALRVEDSGLTDVIRTENPVLPKSRRASATGPNRAAD